MAVNYSSWSVTKLEKERNKIDKVIASKEGKERKKAVADMKAAAKRAGFEVQDLLSDLGIGSGSGAGSGRGKKKSAARRSTGKVAPKYRNPDDPKVTWSGRGRKPKWIEAHLAKHGNLDAVTI